MLLPMATGISTRLTWPARRVVGRLSDSPVHRQLCIVPARWLHNDGRQRLSNIWAPSGSFAPGKDDAEDAHLKLIRAGFIRQSHSGLFQMLPLGLRVQEKIEKLIDKHMRSVGASKLALSTLSSQSLWEKSGRLSNGVSELFRLTDRKDHGYLLCPTHEEEITSLVARTVTSYRDMPLKLYQITRKYRDELRPRHGLLRGREFMMKDLYTFDVSVKAALESYKQVQVAYQNFFDELKLPVLVAKASSGDMGGDLSHEYHLPTSLGEDNVVSCTSCDYVVNDELAEVRAPDASVSTNKERLWYRITEDRTTVVAVWYPDSADGVVNVHAVKALVPDLDASITNPWEHLQLTGHGSLKLVNLIDQRLHHKVDLPDRIPPLPLQTKSGLEYHPEFQSVEYVTEDKEGKPLNLLGVETGNKCPKCADGTLKVQEAIELGHTFYLGTRYSEPLEARVEVPKSILDGSSSTSVLGKTDAPEKQSEMVTLQMGCYGIGVTRLIGAVADHLHDEKGLNWPRKIAPYEVVVLVNGLKAKPELTGGALEVFDRLTASAESNGRELDAVIDDRQLSLGWKMNDADLVGYPVIVIVGKYWAENRECEVQCRRLGVKRRVVVDEVPETVRRFLDQL